MSIDDKYLPDHHNFVFSIGFSRQKDSNRTYKLHEVCIVLDDNFIKYLDKMKEYEKLGFIDIPREFNITDNKVQDKFNYEIRLNNGQLHSTTNTFEEAQEIVSKFIIPAFIVKVKIATSKICECAIRWTKEELAEQFEVPLETFNDQSVFDCAEKLLNAKIKTLCKLATLNGRNKPFVYNTTDCGGNEGVIVSSEKLPTFVFRKGC